MTSPYTATSQVSRRDWEVLAEKYPLVLRAAVTGGAERAVLFAESRRRVRHRLTQVLRNGCPEPPRFNSDQRFLEGGSITVDRNSDAQLESTTEVDAEALLGLARSMAGRRSFSDTHGNLPEGLDRKIDLRSLFEEWQQISREEAEESLRVAAEFAAGLVPQVQRVSIDLIETSGRSFVACLDPAEGAVAPQTRNRVSLVVSCELQGGTKLRVVRGSQNYSGPWLWEAAEAAARELCDCIDSDDTVSIDTRAKLPVLFEAGWCAGVWIHEVVGHSLEADNIKRGWSSLSELLEKKVAPSSLTIVDAPHSPDLAGSMEWDDEAVAARETVLVDAGFLSGILHDRRSATSAGGASTGNGRRQDYRYLSQPRMSNLVVRPGNTDPYQAARPFPRCLVVKSMTGGSLDARSGAFTFPIAFAEVLAYGEPVSMLRNVVVSGSSVEALSAVAAIGATAKSDDGRGRCLKNGQVVDVGMHCPSILIEELTVAPAVA